MQSPAGHLLALLPGTNVELATLLEPSISTEEFRPGSQRQRRRQASMCQIRASRARTTCFETGSGYSFVAGPILRSPLLRVLDSRGWRESQYRDHPTLSRAATTSSERLASVVRERGTDIDPHPRATRIPLSQMATDGAHRIA